ncbi:MAG: hypothetical protein JRJ12_14800 [Deltaproteobacteria bacterium]|nr:hypothetical protein [Deltaproteobacteria bacterium]MBW2072789.1 hypothetical protein [Deltaproteobacteria bacterium]
MKNYLYVPLVLAIFAGLTIVPRGWAGTIPTEEREALIALYDSTDGDNWTSNYGWKEPPLAPDGFAQPGSESGWHGVTVSTDPVSPRVVQINLYSNNLKGTLPAELGNLSEVFYLNLNDNQLTGSIPATLSNLTDLQYCYLHNNQLSGTIPAALGNLSIIRRLYLNNNKLSGRIPRELGNLSSLQQLDLHSNGLMGRIPAELSNLTGLQDGSGLDLCDNHLFTRDDSLRNFLNTKQVGGDWESCQTPPFSPATPTLMLELLQ